MRDLLSKGKSFLIVVENDSKTQVYRKIAKSLGIIVDIIDNFSDFVNLVFNKK
jgi:predicted secreted acid phosphatase